MTGRREGKKALAGPPALAYDSRQAASTALCEIADRMMRGAQSLMRKATRVLDEDPAVSRNVIGHLRRYGNSGMPCAEEMTSVEALLRGVPEDQCRSEQRKKLDKQRQERRKSDEDFCRRADDIAQLRDEIRSFLAAHRRDGILSAQDEDQANQILWAAIDGRRPGRAQVARQVEGNVVEGPWGEAS